MNAAIREFNEAVKLFNSQKYSEAIPVLKGAAYRFKQLVSVPKVLYVYELLAKCHQKMNNHKEAIKAWVFCVGYSVKYSPGSDLSRYVKRFCLNKWRLQKASDVKLHSLWRITKTQLKQDINLENMCVEIDEYEDYDMKIEERECIDDLLARSEEEDKFYTPLAYVLKALLLERIVRIRALWPQVAAKDPKIVRDTLIKSFKISDKQMHEVLGNLMKGLSSLDEIDDYFARKLLKVAHFFYHHGKLENQIKILQMLKGSDDPAQKLLCNAYLIRSMVDIGNFEMALTYIKENEKIINLKHSNSQFICGDDETENSIEQAENEYTFAETLHLIMEGYFMLENNELKECEKQFMEVHSIIKSSVKDNKKFRHLFALCEYYQAHLYFNLCNFDLALEFANNVLELLRGTWKTIPEYIPRNYEFLLIGDIYQTMGDTFKASFYYNRGMQSCIYTRTRVGCIDFVMRKATMEKRQNNFDVSQVYFDLVDELMETYYISDDEDEHFGDDSLDYLTVQHVVFKLEQSDLFLKCWNLPDSEYTLKVAEECIRNSEIDQRGSVAMQKICILAKEYGANLKKYHGMIEKSREYLKQILMNGSKKTLFSYSRIMYLLLKSYIPKKYISQNDLPDFDDSEKIKNLINECISRSVTSVPTITKPIFSAASLVLDKIIHKSFFSNMSLGINLRHAKYFLMKNQIFEMEKNNISVPSRMKKLVNTLKFKKSDGPNMIKIVKDALPSNMVVICMCLSHDFSSIIVNGIERGKEFQIKEIPLILKDGDIQLVKGKSFYNIVKRNFKERCNEKYYDVIQNLGKNERNLLYIGLRELDSIIDESKRSTKKTTIKEDIQKRLWWNRRHQINELMENLTYFIENTLWSDNCLKKQEDIAFQGMPRDKHYVLILDKLLQKFPFEIIPSLRNCSVSRMPSLLMLYSHLLNHKINSHVNIRKAFYVVNPDGTLPKTHKKFQNEFRDVQQKLGWNGFLGKAPTKTEFENAFKNNEMLIYMGHGAGEDYIHSDNIRTAKKCAKLTILMGCGSGRLVENGEFEPTGTVLNYLLSGSHCVIGNLWDVTDKDCDRFSHFLIGNWIRQKKKSIVDLVPAGREKCILKFINGGAVVCYGLPVFPYHQKESFQYL